MSIADNEYKELGKMAQQQAAILRAWVVSFCMIGAGLAAMVPASNSQQMVRVKVGGQTLGSESSQAPAWLAMAGAILVSLGLAFMVVTFGISLFRKTETHGNSLNR